ncbi:MULTISPECIES: SDR family NAD(P)-dependent oxidoreductase [Rhizobium/Agrobacterium group]|jgi:3-oxoacyl-[acyl-carrier protein] reductase|uniref:3-oxoacyl-ACP reductase n=2 Tax=Rhizobium/Agrobacterium group TaxID=227290 RepID=A0A1B9UCS0_AGRTU|nr:MULTISPECIES: SDR family NAD(P)-dependent oxidoreductase [Rhizobium/Agrobacterium group]AHK04078.1 3-oxoacyl-[acyl-carrier protein] reductase [Agrobacterium tumefaciens LBA4213 (Ach5)]AKC09821.1 3-oxoacyl-[acyl-carrier protein] reductase [Agrobacterium tumefaciens]EHJ95773.1 3-oxoacyl-ACP reductase [Agrobacterium tumefaciens 5A]MDP9562203.1 3-oxoacyl-[acyl-carrier protein] reductase [Rhizobium nepotum]ADY67387.1 3-oxoacyl-acyl-carrier-protein reductase [Agrobacterium tumefaciens]
MELKHKTALVTGACGGIGRAVVAALVAQGARVIAFDRDIEAVAALAEGFGGACDPVAVDLGDATALQAVMKDVANRFEVIDILVNNAGVLSPHKLGATTLDDWHRLMAVNLDAALLLTQAVVPAMKENRWGRLINISSYAWKSGGLTAGTAYSVSKSALVGLTYSSARELAPFGVTANAVAPAYVVSPMIMEQLSEEDRQRQLAAIPVGRFCQPEEVAHTVGFLASPLSGFMTGTVVDMNGGLQFG